jgi:hypothetical protein
LKLAKKDHLVTINRVELEELEKRTEILSTIRIETLTEVKHPYYISAPFEVKATAHEDIFKSRPTKIVLVDDSGKVVAEYVATMVEKTKEKWFTR